MTPTISPEVIQEALSSGSGDSGCQQTFIKLNEKWGIKFFTESNHGEDAENYCRQAYELQKKAAEIGCGPDVGDIVCIQNSWGYVTEVVQLFNPYLANNNFSGLWFENDEDFDGERYRFAPSNRDYDSWYQKNFYAKEIKQLRDRLDDEIDFWFADDHGGNLGWKNGNLICIDFF